MSQRNTVVRGPALAGALALAIAACNSDALVPYPQFTIAPRTVNVARGATQNVKIVLAGPNKSAHWTVESGNSGVAQAAQTATGATISGVAAGTARVYVRAPARGFPNGEAVDSLTVNVTGP